MQLTPHRKTMLLINRQLHFFTILILGVSASLWAIAATSYIMPITWLMMLYILVTLNSPSEFRHFLKRFTQIGLLLVGISFLQIIFRRQGTVLVSWHQFPLIYSVGLREAILLWIRFMILFVLANIFAQVSLFNFLLFSLSSSVRFGL